MRGSIRVLLLSAGMVIAGPPDLSAQTPAPAQPPSPAPAGALDRLIISPEFAQSINRLLPRTERERLFGRDIGALVRMLGARLDFRATDHIAPFVATSLLEESGFGNESVRSAVAFAGARVDVLSDDGGARVVPYALAAAGVRYVGDEAGRFVPSAGIGARLVHAGDLSPRVELRYERYAAHNFAMLGIGLNLLFTHRGTVAMN